MIFIRLMGLAIFFFIFYAHYELMPEYWLSGSLRHSIPQAPYWWSYPVAYLAVFVFIASVYLMIIPKITLELVKDLSK